MSDTATPTDATRAGPLPANVTSDAEEKQVVGIDYNCCEGHPWRNTGKLPFVQFIIAYINVPTDRGVASPSDARPDSVPTEVLDGDTGVTSPSNAQPDPVPTEELDDATGPALAIPPVGPDAPAAGDVVSVPLAKFEQLVELLAEAVRERIEIASHFQITHLLFSKPLVLDGSKDSTFAINDLNIKDLESIGGLSIRWTDVFEDHLLLDMVEKTLFIAWFFTDLVSYSAMDTSKQRIPQAEYLALNSDIVASWAMLFATSRRHKDRVSAYEQLGKPDWHSGGEAANDYYNTQPNAYAELRDFHLQGDGHGYHLRYRQTRQAALNKISIPFAEFPALESRLRQLRHYMDDQKPRGIRQLWRDNRDSSNYYTFWLVVAFGLLSVTLAMFSLAVSVAQTWASFRALDQSSSPSVSST
ncbi:hypothetical protein VE00_07300 [Pseudogymnoascus sp. WSF 3629]|nr:hypothetical protein VE00_07300 [Pseudogymnoascus sp. WSF 3629]